MPLTALRAGLLPALLLALLPAPPAGAIASGRPVGPEEFQRDTPWAVVVRTRGSSGICTGALISPTWVLTAGHCAGPGRDVYVGSPSREAARRVAVREAIIHPRFSREPMAYDMALLRLVRPLRIRPLPIASRAEAWDLLRVNGRGRVLGWGAVPGEARPDVLRVAEVTFEELGITGTQIAYRSGRGGPCGGDSGGPLVVRGRDDEAVLVGVASVTDGNLCAAGGGGAAYTNVPALAAFIREHVSDLRERPPPLDFPVRRPADSRLPESLSPSAANSPP